MKRIVSFALIITIILSLALVFGSCDSSGTDDTQGGTNNNSKTPYADALEEAAKDGSIVYTSDWLMYSWITKNIQTFKNPASVELTGNAYYCKGEGETDFKFFLVEFRAENSFGGKTVSYAKVTANAIVTTNWQPTQIRPSFEGEQVWRFGTSGIENAFDEFMENNYN